MSDRYSGATRRVTPAQHFTSQVGQQTARKYIGNYLVEAGLIAPAQVEVVLYDQQRTGMRFGEILAARGWVKQETIDRVMEHAATPQPESANPFNSPPLRKPNQTRNAVADLENAVLRRRRPIAESANSSDTVPTTAVENNEVKWLG